MAKKQNKTDEMIPVRVLKPFDGHKKGDEILVTARKVKDSSREFKRGLIKPIKK